MNLIPTRWRSTRRWARRQYLAADENPAADTARTTLRHSTGPAERATALDILTQRELDMYLMHDSAFGYQPWADDAAGDAATGLAHGVMILRLLRATEAARAEHGPWLSHWTLGAWATDALTATDQTLAATCVPLLDQLADRDYPTEIAVLYTRLWIAAYPIVGGQAAEWIAAIGNDWQCRAAGVQDGPDTVLVLPDAGRGAAQFLPAAEAANKR